MNFNEIPRHKQTKSACPYELRHIRRTINYWNDEYGLELYPDFQRDRKWSEEQQSKFVEYVLQGGEHYQKLIRFNRYPDKDKPYKGQMVIVDGLHRLNSILGFLDNRVKAFGLFHDEFEGKLKNHHELLFAVNTFETRKEVLEWYLQLNSGGIAHTTEELSRVEDLLTKEKQNER